MGKYIKDVYIYVLSSWHENILVARETVRGRIYTSLVPELQIEWVRVERIKDAYTRPWLLEKIRLTRLIMILNLRK